MATRVRAGNAKHEGPPRVRTAVLARAALLVAAGLITYANSLSGPFVLDDHESVVANEQIRQLWPPSAVLFPARELPVAGRPVVNVSFALNYAFGGFQVQGYHAVNLVIHLSCALLLFGIVRRTLARSSRVGLSTHAADLGCACALLWLLHPIQTDAVDYVTQRTELMMGLFYLLTLYASIRGREHTAWLGVAVGACLLGAGSKESMATAPLVVAVYDRIFLFDTWRDAWRTRWPFYIALAASWGVLGALMWSGPRFRSAGFGTAVTPWRYLLNQTVMIVRYVQLSFWPHGFALTYGVPRALALGDVWPYAAVVVLLAALTVLALVRRPALGFLGLWFFVTLAPTSSFVPIATEVGAERRMYLPLAAIVVLVVVSAVHAWERLRGRAVASGGPGIQVGRGHFTTGTTVGVIALAAVAAALAFATVLRNREYVSALSLARLTEERWPTARAEHWLGIELLAAGQHEQGLAALAHALPDDPTVHYTLGLTLFQDGRLNEALPHLQEFVARHPELLEVPAAREMIGRALDAQGKPAEAAEEFRRVLAMTPSNHDVYGLLGDALLKQEKFAEAAGAYQRFLQYRPTNLGGLMKLGIALVASGRNDDAIVAFRRAADVAPKDGAVRRNLARALVAARAFAEAEVHARQAVLLRPDDPVAYDELGVALASQQKWDEAVAVLRRSLQLDPDDDEARAHLAVTLRARDGMVHHR